MRRTLAISVLVVLAMTSFLEGLAYAGEKFVLRATLHRAKGEMLEVGDPEGHRLGAFESVGVAFNTAGSGFLDTAQYVVLSNFSQSKTGVTAFGYKIFTMRDGSKAFARWDSTRELADGREGTFQFLAGTGQLEGLKGGGTWRVWQVAPGLLWDRIEGEYELRR